MKIIQTLWSQNKGILEHCYGWHSAQFHIMSWALSCLKLKEHYDNLHLFTDSQGKKILVEYLNLPYKEVHVCYDDINYAESLWAIPKILTYAQQNEPFIHVDGDVFTWRKFSKEQEGAVLVVQNKEKGTDYYKGMMEAIKKELHYMPVSLKNELNKASASAYNAGVMGGNDIAFFKAYTQEALQLIDQNYKTGEGNQPSINFNILFEQVLFYALAEKEEKKVICLFKKVFEDNGYSGKDFADFTAVPYIKTYLHLIGPHKRNKHTCELMSMTLFKEYPNYFLKVMALFKYEHIHFDTKIATLFPHIAALSETYGVKKAEQRSVYERTQQLITLKTGAPNRLTDEDIMHFVKNTRCMMTVHLYEYETYLSEYMRSWGMIPAEQLYDIELRAVQNTGFFFMERMQQVQFAIEKNSFIKITETTHEWVTDINVLVKKMTEHAAKDVCIACTPRLFFNGFSEMILDNLSYNILEILDQPMSVSQLLSELEVCFSVEEIKNNYDTFYKLILLKLKHLYYNRCIFLHAA